MSDTVVSSKPVPPIAVTTIPLFSYVNVPLDEDERAAPPSVIIVDDEHGLHAKIEPEEARAILHVECQIHVDMVYIVTRSPNREYVLWRQEHSALVPARLSVDLRQRLLSAPGTIKRWTTGDHRIHELETDGRHDMQSTVLIFPGHGTSTIEAESYISLGTVELSDSDWLRNWVVVLDNGRRLGEVQGTDYDSTRLIKL